MKKEIIPIGELKSRLLNLAADGRRINFEGKCLFSGFALNQNWEGRGKILKERLEKLVVEGARFEVQIDSDESGSPVSRWVTIIEYTACEEPPA